MPQSHLQDRQANRSDPNLQGNNERQATGPKRFRDKAFRRTGYLPDDGADIGRHPCSSILSQPDDKQNPMGGE